MAGSGKLVERTLENVGVKAAQLFIDVDQPVFVACDALLISSACAAGAQITLRGQSLWPKPGRSKTMTR